MIILPRLGTWNHHQTQCLLWTRLWYRQYIWTPFCRVVIKQDMRYWWPYRRFLIWLSNHVPERFEERILEYLYPSEMFILFPAQED